MASLALLAESAATESADPAEAELRREALRRLFLAARDDPALYAKVVFGFTPAWHHRVWLARIAEALDDAAPPERRRVCIVAPPGSAKTTAISQWIPCHYLGAHPDRSLLVVTASDSMARQHTLVAGGTLQESAAHRRIFPEPAARPAPAKGWSADGLYLAGTPGKDPAYRAVGLGAHILGSRAHVLILDDAVTQEQAQSAVEMDRARRFVDQTLLSRLHPPPHGGAVVAVGTRWHENDLISHLEGQGFEVLLFPQLSGAYFPEDPAVARDAEGRAPLWPQRFPLEWVEGERRRLGSAQFELLHMGDPVTMGGQVFRDSSWFHPLPARFDRDTRDRLVRVTGIDLAWSSKETADFTVAATLGVDPQDPLRRLYLLHLFRQRLDEGELLPRLAEHLASVRPHAVGVEVGAFRGDATGVLVQQLRVALFGKLPHAPDVQGVRAVQDKVSRARGLAVHAENGLFYADKEGLGPLWPIAERELLGLPLAAHDDIPDALALATNLALGNGLLAAQRPVRVRFGVG